MVDWDMFEGILAELRPRYGPESYNLLRHNCNDFTHEVVQILTGQEIPEYVRTHRQTEALMRSPLGAQLMGQLSGTGQRTDGVTASLVDDISARATEPEQPQAASDSSAVHGIINVTSKAQLEQLQRDGACLAVLYTSPTCPPCRIVEPLFEELASANHASTLSSINRNAKDMTFARVLCSSPSAEAIMAAGNVAATPTLCTYVYGRKNGTVRGADLGEIRTQVNLAQYEVYPRTYASERVADSSAPASGGGREAEGAARAAESPRSR